MKTRGWASWYNTALELYNKGHLKESRKLLIEVQKSSPRYLPALNLLSILDFQLKNYPESKKWTQILIRGSKNPEYLNRYAMILLKEGEVDEAGEVIKKGRKIDNRFPGLIYNDIVYHLKIDQFDKAKNLLTQIPRDHVLFEKSRIYIQNELNKNI